MPGRKDCKTYGAELVVWEGVLALTSGAAVDATNSSLPAGITASKTGTGEYTLTFGTDYKPFGRVTCQVTTEKASAAAIHGEIKSGYSSGTIVLRTVNASFAATDCSAATKLHVLLTARLSSQTAGT